MLATSINVFLNILLLPVYLFLFSLTTFLAITPLFPARVARSNLRQHTRAGFVRSVFGSSAVLFHYALIVLEDFIFWPLGGLLIRDNPEVFAELSKASEEAKKSNKGVAVLSAHFGNIEVTADSTAITLTQQINATSPIIALAKPSKFELANKILNWYRMRRKIEVILTNRKDLVRQMMLGLRQGRALALLVDQKPAHAGLFVDFFGTPAAFPEGGLEVALRTQAEFICITSRRLWPGFYTYEGCWLRHEPHAAEPLNALLSAYARWLEKVVMKSPWQWCWDYKKWSRRPPAPASPAT